MTAGKPARVFPPCAISQAPALFSPESYFPRLCKQPRLPERIPQGLLFLAPLFLLQLGACIAHVCVVFAPASVRLAALEAAGRVSLFLPSLFF